MTTIVHDNRTGGEAAAAALEGELSPVHRPRTTPGWTLEEQAHWYATNEQFVDDVHFPLLYQPRSLVLMGTTMATVVGLALYDTEDQTPLEGFQRSILGVFFVFMAFSSLALPNGPFVRPHPSVWRMVLGMGILYWLVLVLALFQKRTVVQGWVAFLDGGEHPEDHLSTEDAADYAADCSFTAANLWSRTDVFWIAHGLGWLAKALFLRSTWLCWVLSITWECTEILVSPVLPNFKECWWDQVLFDVILCNGSGIMLASWLRQYLEFREYRWESIRDIQSLKGKMRRAAQQFTPVSWTPVHWEAFSSWKRACSLALVCWVVNLQELCTFFLKHILGVPTKHRMNVYRIVLWWLISLPSMKQWYVWVTDPQCKRIGTQCWVTIGILVTEILLCFKWGREMFDPNVAFYTFTQWGVGMLVCTVVGLFIAELVRRNRLQEAMARQCRPPSVTGGRR